MPGSLTWVLFKTARGLFCFPSAFGFLPIFDRSFFSFRFIGVLVVSLHRSTRFKMKGVRRFDRELRARATNPSFVRCFIGESPCFSFAFDFLMIFGRLFSAFSSSEFTFNDRFVSK